MSRVVLESATIELFLFFNDTATTEIYTLSLHDALPIFTTLQGEWSARRSLGPQAAAPCNSSRPPRSEEHTSELQSRQYLVCRLLLEKKQQITSAFFQYLTYL